MTTRTPKATDFTIDVEGVGRFTFARRNMGDELAIQREFAEILQGIDKPTAWLETMGGWLSTLRVLTVRAPDGWDLDELDPLDNETYAKLNRVYEGLRDKERSFRAGSKPTGEAASA